MADEDIAQLPGSFNTWMMCGQDPRGSSKTFKFADSADISNVIQIHTQLCEPYIRITSVSILTKLIWAI